MSLLPGGEHGSRLHQCAWAFAVIALGYQGFVNLHRWHAIAGNVSSLANALNLEGEEEFRRQLAHILDVNGVSLDPAEVIIAVDEAKGEYVISAPCRWTLDLYVRQFQVTRTVQARIPRVERSW